MKEADLPKIWEDPDSIQETLPAEITDEEPIVLPTIEEQRDILKNSNLSNENKSLIESLITMNEVANVLDQIHSTETAETRRMYLNTLSERFIDSRMRNNQVAEELKQLLLYRLLNNVNNLDLELTARLYNDLHETTNLDAQQAFANVNGGPINGIGNGLGGLNLTINNATSEGASITNNTLNANPQQVGQLKEVQAMNASIKGWAGNIPLPKRKSE